MRWFSNYSKFNSSFIDRNCWKLWKPAPSLWARGTHKVDKVLCVKFRTFLNFFWAIFNAHLVVFSGGRDAYTPPHVWDKKSRVNSQQSTVKCQEKRVRSQESRVKHQESRVQSQVSSDKSQQSRVNSEQSTVNCKQPTVNSKQSTVMIRVGDNIQKPLVKNEI